MAIYIGEYIAMQASWAVIYDVRVRRQTKEGKGVGGAGFRVYPCGLRRKNGEDASVVVAGWSAIVD